MDNTFRPRWWLKIKSTPLEVMAKLSLMSNSINSGQRHTNDIRSENQPFT